jgi:type IV pilus assembly protein PilW
MRCNVFSSVTPGIAPRTRYPSRQTGLTLVELMVAITIGLIVLLAVGSIYLSSRQTYRVQEDNARVQEAGKYALEVIGRSIKQAGANAEMNFSKTATSKLCNVAGTCVAIAGTNGAAAAADTLTVQFYANREELNGGAWIARDCTGDAAALGTVVTNTFDVTGTDLRCTGSVAGVAKTQPLVENVEDFQVVYGIDKDTSVDPGYQSADQYVAAPTAAQWPKVVTARVCVRIQSANNGLTPSPQKYLNCAGALGTATGASAYTTAVAGDLRLHRSFVATYNLRNRVAAAP